MKNEKQIPDGDDLYLAVENQTTTLNIETMQDAGFDFTPIEYVDDSGAFYGVEIFDSTGHSVFTAPITKESYESYSETDSPVINIIGIVDINLQ